MDRYSPFHLYSSVRQLCSTRWVLGERLEITKESIPSPYFWPSWSDGKGGFFVLNDTPGFIEGLSLYVPELDEIQLVHKAGNGAAVWRAGEAFIKVHKMRMPMVNTTPEHVTLNFLWSKKVEKPLDFEIPKVLYHGEFNDRTYLITSRVPGQPLYEAWPQMDEATKHHYVCRIADICQKLSAWQHDTICGVDGQNLLDEYLGTKPDTPDQQSPQRITQTCDAMGMDASALTVFYHCDLGPSNILVDLEKKDYIGIIDWESAGYVPREWVRTKFRVSSGLDLPNVDANDPARWEWRKRVQIRMGEMGFGDVVDGFMRFRGMPERKAG